MRNIARDTPIIECRSLYTAATIAYMVDKIVLTTHNNKMVKLTDLNTIFHTWAWTTYLKTSSGRLLSRKLTLEQANIQLVWDNVKITSLTPNYTKLESDSPRFQVVYDSKYENETDDDQEQTFRAEEETVSTATITLNRGFTRDVNAGISLTLPPDLRDASRAEASFGHRMHVDNAEESTVERAVKWKVDTKITSRRRNVTVAKLVIEETSAKREFTMTVKMKGRIVAVIRDGRGEGRQVMTIQGDVATIVGDRKRVEALPDAIVDPSSRTVKWSVSGSVYFRYGVSQTVKTSYESRRHSDDSDQDSSTNTLNSHYNSS